MNLGAVSRGSSGTNLPTANFSTTSVGGGAATIGVTTANTNGILGGWATWNGTTYAINNGSDVMAGLADANYTRTNEIGNLNTENVTLDLANVTTTFTSGTATAQAVRISSVGTLNLGGRSFTTSGFLLSAAAGTGDTTITGGNATFSPGVVMQHNLAGRLIFDTALSAATTKGGEGTLRLNATSTVNGNVSINTGTVELGADNALGTGTLSLRDQSGTGGFVASGGDRTIANNSALGSTQNTGTFRGVRFSGSNNLTVTGIWQGGDTSSANSAPNRITVDMAAGKATNFGSATNGTGTFVTSDTNSGTNVIDGACAGDLRFFNPVQGSVQNATAGGTLVIDRSGGLTIFDRSGGYQNLQIRQGIAVVKDATSAATVTKAVGAIASGASTFTVDTTTGIVLGQGFASSALVGANVTGIDTGTNTITINKGTTAAIAAGNLIFRPLGTAGFGTGATASHVESAGVLSLGANIAAPALSATSRGTLAINTTGYGQNINLSTLDNGAMFLGSADASGTADTSVVNGTITGGTLTPGALST